MKTTAVPGSFSVRIETACSSCSWKKARFARPGERIEERLQPELLLQLPLGGDVEQVALQVERLAVVPQDDDPVVANPDNGLVACDEPVLETQRLVRSVSARVRGEHAIAIIGMQGANEEVRIIPPLLDGVAEQRLDPAAREDVGAALVQSVDVDDERQLLDERAVTPLDLSSLALYRRGGSHAIDAAVHHTEIGPTGRRAVTPKGDLRGSQSCTP